MRGGEIAEIGAPGSLEAQDGIEVVDAAGLHAFPAFVDPHVHLRTPGREDEEDIETGTRSAAAGGFCAILAMPNTDPVVDSASVLLSLRERARAEARVPTGFTAAVTVGQQGEQLTEMAELADAGAAGFTDDGLPLRSAGVMRQALQYQRLAGRTIALHEEDPSLCGDGVMHEGEVSALLGLAGIPSVSESVMVARDTELAAYEEGRIHVQHVSARETVEVLERAKAAGVQVTRRGDAAPPAAHRRVRPRAGHPPQDEPAAARRGGPPGADRGPALGRARTASPPTTRRTRARRRRSRSRWRRWGSPASRPRSPRCTPSLVVPGVLDLALVVERLTAGGEPFGLHVPRAREGPRRPTSAWWTSPRSGRWGRPGYESRSANCAFAGRRLTGRVRMTVAAGAVAFRERSFAIGAVA